MYTGHILAKFHGNILSLSEKIAKSFRGLLFLTHTVYTNTALGEVECESSKAERENSRRRGD